VLVFDPNVPVVLPPLPKPPKPVAVLVLPVLFDPKSPPPVVAVDPKVGFGAPKAEVAVLEPKPNNDTCQICAFEKTEG
jgi:hypothetical protein